MSFPKDTSPNAIKRAGEVSKMSFDQAIASLRLANQQLIAQGLMAWWVKTLEENGVPFTHPLINERHVTMTNSVNEAVAQYDKTFARLFIDHAISATRKKAGWKIDASVRAVLLALFQRMEQRNPRPLPDIPQEVLAVIPLDVVKRINRMARYTAMNISQFEGVPPPKLKTQLQNAVWAADLDGSRQDGLGRQMSRAKFIGTCDAYTINAIRVEVDKGRGGICTTFAAATASVLLEGLATRHYRVELISGPNHCFCLVNRAVATNEVRDKSGSMIMPGKSFWGPHVILIDAWAGALGHPVFYKSPEDFPAVLQCMLTMKLQQHFDNG